MYKNIYKYIFIDFIITRSKRCW